MRQAGDTVGVRQPAGPLHSQKSSEANRDVTDEELALRTQWEYGHAVNAVVTFAATAILVSALVLSRRVR